MSATPVSRPKDEESASFGFERMPVGAKQALVDDVFHKVADRYETEVDQTVDTTFKLIEPILLVIMAVIVGFIVFALFMPLLTMMQQMSKR